MNSLVVLLSVVALAAAKPSGLLDAGVLTYSAPIIAAAPAAVSHQSRVDIKASPAIVATAAVAPIAPIARTIVEPVITAPVSVAAPAAVSHQSRVDIKSSPAVVSTYAAAPLAYSAPWIAPSLWNAAFVASAAGPVVPLDTPEVIAARAAHFQAKAIATAHSIHKRSASLLTAAPLVSTYTAYASPVTAVAPVAHYPYALHTPVITKAYSVHPW